MKKIYKFPVSLDAPRFKLLLPRNHEVLTVQVQRGEPVMWIKANFDDLPTVPVDFQFFLTGESIPPIDTGGQEVPETRHFRSFIYVGTFQLEEGDTVIHLFKLQ